MPKLNESVNKSRIRGRKNSFNSKGKTKDHKKSVPVSPAPKNISGGGGSGCRQSKRLQQQKITESWSGNVHKTKTWPETRKTASQTIADDVCDNIQTDESETSKNVNTKPKTKLPTSISTNSVPEMSSTLDGLNREDKLQILRNFDLQGLYGPCRGISRRSRFERALTFNLNPVPQEIVLDILKSHPNDPEFERCIWDCNELLRVKLGSPMKKGP